MPNGISCAYFAGKNLLYGQKEKNVFKEGIAGIQATRTVDTAVNAGVMKVPNKGLLNRVTNIAKRFLYPLIILSGVHNTIKSDDKVKTGIEQTAGISTMFAFEQIAEKGLNSREKKLTTTNIVKNNKKVAFGLYVLKGLTFVAASVLGYNTGSKLSQKGVDKFREMNAEKSERKKIKIKVDENINEDKCFVV